MNDEPTHHPSDTLRAAIELLEGDREVDYGDAVENHARIAKLFNEITGHQLNARDVALIQVCTKLSRLRTTPDHSDSFVDAAAYLGIASAAVKRG